MMNDIHDMTGMVPLYQFIGVESERDRLAAENAELRKQCAAFHAEANDHYRASIAANATLDRLRCEFEKWQACDKFTAYDLVGSMQPILYPTPENKA